MNKPGYYLKVSSLRTAISMTVFFSGNNSVPTWIYQPGRTFLLVRCIFFIHILNPCLLCILLRLVSQFFNEGPRWFFRDRNLFLSSYILFHLAAMHPGGAWKKQQSEEIHDDSNESQETGPLFQCISRNHGCRAVPQVFWSFLIIQSYSISVISRALCLNFMIALIKKDTPIRKCWDILRK